MSEASEFYQPHLDRVSRSFAFCIRQLPEPLKSWVGLSYLLCRVVDTIEDSAWVDLMLQMQAFADFDRAMREDSQSAAFAKWSEKLPSNIPLSEKNLITESAKLFADLHKLPPQVSEMIRDLVLCMSSGMQHFCAKREDGKLRLSSLNEVNQYCFFVAGVVGELLAKLLGQVEKDFVLDQHSLLRAHHFGLFLQKVNLLKDQVGDEKEGRHLIPSREKVEASAEENAVHALEFLQALPERQIEFRRFCAWSLFLGLESLRVARDSEAQQKVLKVPRSEMEKILAKVEAALESRIGLKELFAEYAFRLGWKSGKSAVLSRTGALPGWLPLVYPGLLDSTSLEALGL